MSSFKAAFAALSALAAASLWPGMASADDFQFSLTPSDQSPGYFSGFSGSGYAAVDLAGLPASGTGTLAASDLEFNLEGRVFGYSIGSYTIVGDIFNQTTIYDPPQDAFMSFESFVPVGLSYSQFHYCDVTYHCLPNEFVSLHGSSFSAFIYPVGGTIGDAGTITFAAPIPEPGEAALIFFGLVTIAAVGGRRRARR